MTPQRIIFRAWVRLLERLTLSRRPLKQFGLPESDTRCQLLIITIAFNNAELIRYQYKFLKKNITDDYIYLVADNSSNKDARVQIESFCKQNQVAYVSLPKNSLNKVGGSYSHAMCLNYVYHHIIKTLRPYVFGYIDHDLFPVKKLSVCNILSSQPVYGPLRERAECWYLSAIMSFFRYDYVQDKKVDFMPVMPYKTYLDSGGGNWYDIYSRLNMKEINFPDECIEPLREGGDRHGDSLEWFDNKNWLHTINGSCWKEIAAGKDHLIKDLLDNYLSND